MSLHFFSLLSISVCLLILEKAEIHVFGENRILVATRDVLSFALVYPDSFSS